MRTPHAISTVSRDTLPPTRLSERVLTNITRRSALQCLVIRAPRGTMQAPAGRAFDVRVDDAPGIARRAPKAGAKNAHAVAWSTWF